MPADLTTALGALLSDRTLRETLRRDPREVARRLQIPEADLHALDSEALEIQAESLIDKRRHEVSKQLPRTMALLGDLAPGLFREHAGIFWPEGHRRHVLDAARFGAFLMERGSPLCRSEWNRARFVAGSSPLGVRYAPDVWIGGRSRRAVEVFLRHRGTVRSRALYCFGL
ncbi:MAG TPA: hypothetical protein VKW04_19300 [Planctomycetota bacterium]|nr:hypothetical protein [Planctomycetota bacterium]